MRKDHRRAPFRSRLEAPRSGADQILLAAGAARAAQEALHFGARRFGSACCSVRDSAWTSWRRTSRSSARCSRKSKTSTRCYATISKAANTSSGGPTLDRDITSRASSSICSTACAPKAFRSRCRSGERSCRRSRKGSTARACSASTIGRACLFKSETYFDAYDRVFARVFKGVEGALGDKVTAESLAARPKNFPTCLRKSSPSSKDCRLTN
jgi:hypothetical protein